MLVIGIVSDMSASLGAVLASAPTGTPLSLYLSTDGKEGLARRTAFWNLRQGQWQGSIGLLAFSLATRCIVLYGGNTTIQTYYGFLVLALLHILYVFMHCPNFISSPL